MASRNDGRASLPFEKVGGALMQLAAPVQDVVEDGPFLWLARELIARGPNGRLINLVRHDERLAAYLGAIRVHRADIKSTIESEFHKGEPAFNFLAASLALMTEDAKFFRSNNWD